MKRKLTLALLSLSLFAGTAPGLERLPYHHPGLVVDLGVGLWAWPLPMDFDEDGDLDLVVNCPDKPYNGVYFFENATGDTAKNPLPVFKPGRRISKGLQNTQVSFVNGQPRVLTPGNEYPDFRKTGLGQPVKLPLPANLHPHRVRANQWRYVDFDGNGALDLIVGVGDWTAYGWDNAYDARGHWTNGPLRGLVYYVRNTGTTAKPEYAKPVQVMAGEHPVEVFGMPSPNCADFDGDGDLDLLCGEFLDGFTCFENVGTRTAPRYGPGQRLPTADGQPLAMDLQMITPTAMDWDKDGDLDLIVGDEDGRVAFVENTGKLAANRTPQFLPPRYFQQEAADVKFGALATPVGFDWDGDGDTDILSGNTAGYIAFIENLSGPGVEHPKWAAPKFLEVGGRVLRIMAGPNGSIQGPCEAKWGYTTQTVADWDGDGLPDLVVNSIWGKVHWYRNVGTRTAPNLAAAQPIEVEWNGPQPQLAYGWLRPQGKELLTQWRTTPVAVDWNRDGLMDLVMLDHEGYLAFFERARRDGKRIVLPPRRVFCNEQGQPLRLNAGLAGKSGRRKLCVVDWDGDGKLDLLLNSANANFLRQVDARDGIWRFRDMGLLDTRNIEGHDVSPAVVDWNGDGTPDFLGGAEDGRFYYLRNPGTNAPTRASKLPRDGQVFPVAGHPAFLILPTERPLGRPTPWVWYAPTLPGLPGSEERWMFDRLLAAGIAIGGVDVGESCGSPKGRAVFTAFHRELVEQRGLAPQACLLARSRGGLMLYNWAVEHPDSVAGIAGIYPVCNLKSYPGVATACGAYGLTAAALTLELAQHNPIARLAPLAEAKVPIFHIHGDADEIVPLADNSGELARRYRALGGPIELIVPPGQGHSLWPGFFQCQALVDFLIRHATAGRSLAAPSSVALVKEGRPQATIVVAQTPTPSANFAALELQYHVKRITGVELPRVNDTQTVAGPRILVGHSQATAALGIRGDDFAPLEYRIQIAPGTIVLVGRDWQDTPANRAEAGRSVSGYTLQSARQVVNYQRVTGGFGPSSIELPGLFDEQGTCYAVYDFLERYGGVRWYGPTEINIVSPSTNTLVAPIATIQRRKDLKLVDGFGGGWPIINQQWNKPRQDDLAVFHRRLRAGGERWSANHTIHAATMKPGGIFGDPSFKAVGSANQLCYTHAGLIRTVAQVAMDYFDGKFAGRELPAGIQAMGDHLALVPDDSASWCQCSNCAPILAQSRQDARGQGQFSHAADSYYIFNFVNQVAKSVGPSHPDKYIAALAYWGYFFKPRNLPLAPNLSVAPCIQTCYAYVPATFTNELAGYREWVADAHQTGRPLYLWNYFHHPMEPAVIGNWHCFPAFLPHAVSTEVKRYIQDGVRGVYLCGIGQQLDYYLYLKTAFDGSTDCDELLEEFFARYFGAAGGPLKQFYLRIEQIHQTEGTLGTSPKRSWGKLGTPPRMAELEGYINQALALSANASPIIQQRVGTWKVGVWDYMKSGFEAYAATEPPAR